MMTFAITTLWVLTLYLAVTAANPVKMTMLLMIMGASTFLLLGVYTSTIWFSTIFLMLFAGGILMMFMILSSILPNEVVKKFKFPAIVILIFLSSAPLASPSEVPILMPSTKWFLASGTTLITTIVLISVYFLAFIYVLSKSDSPLRSSSCQKSENFVNFLKNMAMSILRKEEKTISIINNSLWDLPSPSTLTYFWNFGSTLGLCLAVQILTGLLLTFHYTSYAFESFSSVIEIMREVWSGWVIRMMHMNGASVFFFFIYLHLFRGMFYVSSVHKAVWNSGVTIMITLMAISFLGYVLPWGQMSYWAVAVITNLFSIVPLVGTQLVNWIWGGFSVSSPTLTRFYSLHFLLPFALSFLVIIHLFMLHKEGSSNSLGINSNIDKVEFHPYFTTKDLYFIVAVISISMMISFYTPYILGDPVNSVPANAMQTPVHIQPEWYFLTSYAILRSLPSKTAGVIALGASVAVFYLMPLFNLKFSTKFTYARFLVFWVMIASFLFLMKMGSLPAEEPYVLLSKLGGVSYFISVIALNL